VAVSKDRFVYVCDRVNDRVQVFRTDGTFVQEAFFETKTIRSGSVWDMTFSHDPEQTYIYQADGVNEEVRVLRRDTLEVLTTFGDGGRQQAIENVVLAAGQVEVRPVFYRGRKIGEQTRRDRTLDLHLLKQADAAALREERRRDAERDFEGRVAAEVERRVFEMSRSARQVTPPAESEFSNTANDIEPADCDIAVAR
jgi:hypothetical protein